MGDSASKIASDDFDNSNNNNNNNDNINNVDNNDDSKLKTRKKKPKRNSSREEFAQSSLLDKDFKSLSLNAQMSAGLYHLMTNDDELVTPRAVRQKFAKDDQLLFDKPRRKSSTSSLSSRDDVGAYLSLPVPEMPSVTQLEGLSKSQLIEMLMNGRDRESCNAAVHQAKINASRRKYEWLCYKYIFID